MNRLVKQDVEQLLILLETDPERGALEGLRKILGIRGASMGDLVALTPFTDQRKQLLLDGDRDTLETLVVEMCELRTLKA